MPEATVEESHLTQENRIKIEGFRQKGWNGKENKLWTEEETKRLIKNTDKNK